MSLWRRIALAKLPELRSLINSAPNIMALWIELQLKLGSLYGDPANEQLISRVYDFASWSLNDSRNLDTRTAVVCAFYEHLPKMPTARADLPNQLRLEDFEKLKQSFKYLLTEQEHEEFINEFLAHKCERGR